MESYENELNNDEQLQKETEVNSGWLVLGSAIRIISVLGYIILMICTITGAGTSGLELLSDAGTLQLFSPLTKVFTVIMLFSIVCSNIACKKDQRRYTSYIIKPIAYIIIAWIITYALTPDIVFQIRAWLISTK